MAGESEVWIDALARVVATVAGLKGAIAYAGGKGGAPATVVKPLPGVLAETPAALVVPIDFTVLAGTWERQTWNVEVQIYLSRADLSEAYGEMMFFPSRVMAAFEAHTRAFNASGVQSAIYTGGRFIDVEWPTAYDQPGPIYLVQVTDVQVKVNVPRNYQAA